jgi:hypothetical protein
LFVLPRMSPDGAEAVLTTGRFVRSVPRDDRAERGASRLAQPATRRRRPSLVMRVADPTGDYVAARRPPRPLVGAPARRRRPAYRVYPEGTIDHWDGFTIPAPSFVGDNPVDLNRNFPWSWAPVHEQIGAGRFPLSEPESRAVVEFTSAHPEIFAWLNLHCYGGVFIRPLGHAPDSKMDQGDLAVFRQLEGWAKQLTGYPTVSGYEEFLYAPDKPLHGDLTDYAYNQRGALAYVVELWDLFKRLELPTPKKFVDYYTQFDRAAAAKLAAWDRAENAGRVIRPWRRFTHPQLGPVEIGGIDVRIGVWNPPPELLADDVRAAQRVLRPGRRAGAVGGRALAGRGRGRRRPDPDRAGGRQPRLPGDLRSTVGQEARVERAAVRRAGGRRLRPGRARAAAGHPRPPRRLGPRGRRRRRRARLPALGRQRRQRSGLLAGARSRRVAVRVGAARVGWQDVTIDV